MLLAGNAGNLYAPAGPEAPDALDEAPDRRRQHEIHDACGRLSCARPGQPVGSARLVRQPDRAVGLGKSTIFNIVAGLQEPSEGRILIDGVDATGTIGRVGYMLQKDLLLPWRTLTDNIILGMEIQGVRLAEARARALPLLRRYGLAGFENAYPRALSGGMRQRAALLRTLLFDTDVILLDEPFGALDAQTKLRMQEWLLQLWGDFGKTVVFVTHDVEEAIFLSDEVHVMGTRPGRILETIAVALPRPRVRACTTTAEFMALKERCLELLHSQAPSMEDAA
jgi:ABC-type nitrate/sulfonate/bicarbonate transport system ATPase subunit